MFPTERLVTPDSQEPAGNPAPRSQQLVKWDSYSLIINGARIFFWAGEFHPFRLPVQALWIDVFEKIKAMGYNGVSFYLDWALLEGRPGHIRADGVFAIGPFCKAAAQVGLYLIARPGPYINAEVSGGGLPGWLQRASANLRTSDKEYAGPALEYMAQMARFLAPYQITQGGPIVLFQIENEYTILEGSLPLDSQYMAAIKRTIRDNGIVVPLTVNDAKPLNTWSPGSGEGEGDIYGWDGYPFGYGPGVTFCSDPTYWPSRILPSKLFDYNIKKKYCPGNPFFLAEFQGSTVQGWGSDAPQSDAANLINAEFERVVYKDFLANGVRMVALYMTFGGTNWGNLGFPGSTTSYDEGAAISEERLIDREKYSEAKLQANFVKVAPALLTSIPHDGPTEGVVDSPDLKVTVCNDTQSTAKFYTVRHTDYTSRASTSYHLTVETARGRFLVPQLGNCSMTLHGRDAKIHVSDFWAGPTVLYYSTAEIFTVVPDKDRYVLVLYGHENESHEIALNACLGTAVIAGHTGVRHEVVQDMLIVSWRTSPQREILRFGTNLEIHLVDRKFCYEYWRLDESSGDGRPEPDTILLRGGYLMRGFEIDGDSLMVRGDIRDETLLEIVATPCAIQQVYFNGARLQTAIVDGFMTATIPFNKPDIAIPDLRTLDWRSANSLPEILPSYDDSSWTLCSLPFSNSCRGLSTPTSLYGGDYGFHCGSLLYRGRFTARGNESWLSLTTSGGSGFGHSIWIDELLMGSFIGAAQVPDTLQKYNFPKLKAGSEHILTVLVDHMGYEMQFIARSNSMKSPRGILNYGINGDNERQGDIEWRLTGNLGGESYCDLVRGPLNEGGMYAERQGWHLPLSPLATAMAKSPYDGLSTAGVEMFYARLHLDLPLGYDIPLEFVFEPAAWTNFRCQLYVNGYQFGKFVNNLGPQKRFPVPEGILNHQGDNWIALTLWSLDRKGAKLADFRLGAKAVIRRGYASVEPSPQPAWERRLGAY